MGDEHALPMTSLGVTFPHHSGGGKIYPAGTLPRWRSVNRRAIAATGFAIGEIPFPRGAPLGRAAAPSKVSAGGSTTSGGDRSALRSSRSDRSSASRRWLIEQQRHQLSVAALRTV